MFSSKSKILFNALFIVMLDLACAIVVAQNNKIIKVEGKEIRIEFDRHLYCRVVSYLNGQQKILGKFNPSEYVEADGRDIKNFKFEGYKCFDFEDTIGAGKKFEIRSSARIFQKC